MEINSFFLFSTNKQGSKKISDKQQAKEVLTVLSYLLFLCLTTRPEKYLLNRKNAREHHFQALNKG